MTSQLSLPAPSNVTIGQLVSDRNLIDALPYIDKEYELPGVRDAALALIEEECRRYRPTKNYLDYLPLELNLFETETMRVEFERIAARQPMEMLSMKRYELPAPAAGQKNDITAWNECVDNSLAQLEHMGSRIENLELLEKYGSNAWKTQNEMISKLVEQAQKQLSALKRDIQETNWQRKSDQMAVSTQLLSANDEWNHLVHKNFDIEAACLRLNQEITLLEEEYSRISALVTPTEVRKRKVLETQNQQQSFFEGGIEINGHSESSIGANIEGAGSNGGSNSDDENRPPVEKVQKTDNSVDSNDDQMES
ncbi:pre-mRNA-splicing factor SPF27-like [Convolutriloba macropyga]|uniref:pre-mRNA-splicing factor SPF27-like n=1 Tax=Convolutriloba macropyga TaxID=536237 RepID=UPI003F522A06